jgi:hypothetical protein
MNPNMAFLTSSTSGCTGNLCTLYASASPFSGVIAPGRPRRAGGGAFLQANTLDPLTEIVL